MFYKIDSEQKGGLLEQKKDDDRIILVYHWNSCGHCRTFMPILYNLLREQHDLMRMANIFEVEYDNFKYLPEDLTNISAFPSVVAIENGKKIDEFSEQRTPENLEQFITKNSSIKSSYTTSPSSQLSSQSSLRTSSARTKRILNKYSKYGSKI